MSIETPTVVDARLLGFCRSVCLAGPEPGLVLVRAIWSARAELMPWDPRFEARYHRVILVVELLASLWMDPGYESIYHRALVEAELISN